MPISKHTFTCGLLSLLFLFTGCTTIVNAHRQKTEMVTNYLNGNAGAALSYAAEEAEDASTNSVMWNLEAGSLAFHCGNYDACLKYLSTAEDQMADYDERALISLRDIGAETGSLFTNLNALPYQGLCRDRMMLPVFKSMAYLASGNTNSFQAQVRGLRNHHADVLADYETLIREEQAGLEAVRAEHSEEMDTATSFTLEDVAANEQNAEIAAAFAKMNQAAVNGYTNFLNPIAIFFSGIASLYDNSSMDNAAIEFKRLYDAMPANPMVRQYYRSVLNTLEREIPRELRRENGFDFPLERNCVFVIMGNGLSATLDQSAIYWPIMVAWPSYISFPRPFTCIDVSGGDYRARSSQLADMDGIFAAEMKRRMLPMLVRTVLSTAVKETMHHVTIASLRETIDDAFAREMAVLAAEVAFVAYKAAFNTADTRSWEILPAEFQVCQIPMPEDRRITLELGGTPIPVQLPANCTSSIVYVSAPSVNAVTIHPLPLNRY